MRISSQASQFVYNLPSDFLPTETLKEFAPLLEKNWIQYDDVISYCNSTIKGINYPGFSIDTPEQRIKRGKKLHYKPATNINDIVSSNELTVTFRSVDSDLNYICLCDIFSKHYLDTDHIYVAPFIFTALDIHRDAIYQIKFKDIIFKSISENNFNYSVQRIQAKEFTCTFIYDFFDIEYMLDHKKLLELGVIPTIIQKI